MVEPIVMCRVQMRASSLDVRFVSMMSNRRPRLRKTSSKWIGEVFDFTDIKLCMLLHVELH